tara:strand:+ start:930 stop:1088 length:159 start_codon:yes stop_codon:yes gene_type:complete
VLSNPLFGVLNSAVFLIVLFDKYKNHQEKMTKSIYRHINDFVNLRHRLISPI